MPNPRRPGRIAFSGRSPRDLQSNSLVRLLHEKRLAGVPVIDLSESNPTRVGIEYPRRKILQALQDPQVLYYTPSPLGLESARRSIADYYAERGARVDWQDIILTSSTSEAYSLIFKLLVEPGDEIWAPHPGYPLIEHLAQAEGIQARYYPLVYGEGWLADFGGIEAGLGPRCRLFAAIHPNNPTGNYLKPGEWRWLSRTCLRRAIPLVCDEVFFDYPLETASEPIFHPLREDPEVPLFLLNGLSKTTGLPQMKLAWMVLRGPADFKQEALSRLEFLSDNLLSIGTPVQCAAPMLLEAGKSVRARIQTRLHQNLRHLQGTLKNSAADVLRVEGGWYAVLRLPQVASERDWVSDLLAHWDVWVHPGYFYGFQQDGFIVISLLPASDQFEQGVERILEAVRKRT